MIVRNLLSERLGCLTSQNNDIIWCCLYLNFQNLRQHIFMGEDLVRNIFTIRCSLTWNPIYRSTRASSIEMRPAFGPWDRPRNAISAGPPGLRVLFRPRRNTRTWGVALSEKELRPLGIESCLQARRRRCSSTMLNRFWLWWPHKSRNSNTFVCFTWKGP